MAQQEGNSDVSTKFSTLNVNAMEFVPSFCTNVPPTSATSDSEATAPAAETTPVDESSVPPENTPKSQDASPTKTNAEPPVSVTATTEPIDDKSPDNPGMYNTIFFSHNLIFLLLDFTWNKVKPNLFYTLFE